MIELKMRMNSHGMVYCKVGFYMQTNKMAATAGQFNMALWDLKKKDPYVDQLSYLKGNSVDR